jgi:hypothetical protein
MLALERQAVAEAVARPMGNESLLDEATNRFSEMPDLTRLVELRASILELTPGTSAAMVPETVLVAVQRARREVCETMIANGEAERFAGLCRELATSIGAADRLHAEGLVAAMADMPRESARR